MYQEQIDFIANFLRLLNDFSPQETELSQLGRIPFQDSDGFLYGHFVDEIGGAWKFEPTTEKSVKK